MQNLSYCKQWNYSTDSDKPFQTNEQNFLWTYLQHNDKETSHYTGIEVIDQANSHQSSNQY